MRMRGLVVAALMLAGSGGAALAADPLEGVWQTQPDDNGHYGHIEVKPCGSAFCGVLVRAFDETGTEAESPNVGKQIVWDMLAEGNGSYGGGMIWSPDRDKTYKSQMTLTQDGLSVEGCVLFVCRNGGTWSRVE